MTQNLPQTFAPQLSNSEVAKAATDKMIEGYARADGKGEVARVDFLQDVADAFLNKTLGNVVRTTKKGKELAITETDYAQYAWQVWNAARAKVLNSAEVRPVKDSRKSELTQIFKAVGINPNVVKQARAAVLAASAKDADFKGKTYEGIVKVARVQIAMADEHGAEAVMTDIEAEQALYTEPKVKVEEDEVAKVIKTLKGMAETFPANADIYNCAVEGMEQLLATLVSRKARDEKMAAYLKMQAELGLSDAA